MNDRVQYRSIISKTPQQLKELRILNVAVIHPDDADGRQITQQLQRIGCRGPRTRGDCANRLWNDGSSWCVDSNGMCFGCTDPDFPAGDFYPDPKA